jgi:hypothetical protein
LPYYYKGFFIQCFCIDGIHWIGWAESRLRDIEFQSAGAKLTEQEAGSELTKFVDIYTKGIN